MSNESVAACHGTSHYIYIPSHCDVSSLWPHLQMRVTIARPGFELLLGERSSVRSAAPLECITLACWSCSSF